MIKATFVYALLLIVLGIGGYILTDFVSVTALIPAFFGVVFLILAFLARKESLRKHMMHAASFLALLGFLGTVWGFKGVYLLLAGEEVERAEAAMSRSMMALLSLAFFCLCMRSFIRARRSG
ncbi:MAG: hypothetical protein ACYTG7_12340 [Planctomycetota bacterium]